MHSTLRSHLPLQTARHENIQAPQTGRGRIYSLLPSACATQGVCQSALLWLSQLRSPPKTTLVSYPAGRDLFSPSGSSSTSWWVWSSHVWQTPYMLSFLWAQDAVAGNHTQKRTRPAMNLLSTLRSIFLSGWENILASLFIPALWGNWRQNSTIDQEKDVTWTQAAASAATAGSIIRVKSLYLNYGNMSQKVWRRTENDIAVKGAFLRSLLFLRQADEIC